MNIRKISLLSFVFIINVSNLSFGMNQKDNIIKQFYLSKLQKSSLDTLIAFNKNNHNKAVARLFFAVPVVTISTLLQINSMYRDCYVSEGGGKWHSATLFRPSIDDQSFLLGTSVISLLYMGKKGYSVYTRQWMMNNLQKMKNNNSNFFDQHLMNKIIQKDIKKNATLAKILADKL